MKLLMRAVVFLIMFVVLTCVIIYLKDNFLKKNYKGVSVGNNIISKVKAIEFKELKDQNVRRILILFLEDEKNTFLQELRNNSKILFSK